MIPATQQILNVVMKASQLHPEWTVSEIASHMGYAPMFVINALELGVQHDLLEWDREEDTIKTQPLDVSSMVFPYGDEVARVGEEIVHLITTLNSREEDLEEGRVYQWLNNVRPLFVELVLDKLMLQGTLVRYDLADPKDKESVYTFVTLAENEQHKWGAKQFKVQPKVDSTEE